MNIVKNFKFCIVFIIGLFGVLSVSLSNNEGYYSLSEALQSNIICDTSGPCIYIDADKTKAGWYQSGSMSGFKFYCNAGISVKTTLTDYNAVSWYLKYDTSVLTNRSFNISDYIMYPVFPDVNSSLPSMGGANKGLGNPVVTTFSFVPSTGFYKAWIDVCNIEGVCTPYTPTTSSTGGLGYVRAGSPANVLKAVKGAIYDLYAWPCTPDTKEPVITSILNNKVYSGQQNLTGLIYDYDANNVWHYWFNGHDYSETGLNYVYVETGIDNQQGIDERTINVSISCPTCSWSQTTQILTATKTRNSGNSNRNVKTWNNKDRGYLLSFTTPRLELERQTTVTISGCDIKNETGVNHCKTQTFTFNKPKNPNITGMYNTNGTEWRTDNVFPSMTNEYMITVSDDPAGINPSSITITFNEATDLSGNTTPTYVLSGNELSVSESGTLTDYGVRTIYEVRFHPPYDLLEGTQTRMTVYVEDYVGNVKSQVFNLNTRGSCSSFGGCRDYLNINHFSNLDAIRLFSGLNIVVTGTDMNSIYPYLTGDTLFCGNPWTGMTLYPEGKMNLYKRGERDIKDSLTITRPNQNMYKAERSDDLDYDTERTSDSRSLVNKINVR